MGGMYAQERIQYEVGKMVYIVSNGRYTFITQEPPSPTDRNYVGYTVTRIGVAIEETCIQNDSAELYNIT